MTALDPAAIAATDARVRASDAPSPPPTPTTRGAHRRRARSGTRAPCSSTSSVFTRCCCCARSACARTGPATFPSRAGRRPNAPSSSALDLGADVPAEIPGLLPALTTDVLVHTWDLARAVGADETLDTELCELAEAMTVANAGSYSASGGFAGPLSVDAGADVQTRLLARLGRRR